MRNDLVRGIVVAALACFGIAPPAGAVELERLGINGFASFELNGRIGEAGRADSNWSFHAEVLALLFNFQVAENVRVAANLSWEHGGGPRGGTAGLEYAFLEHVFADEFRIFVGKASTPFGVFNEIRHEKPAFLSLTVPVTMIDPGRLVDSALAYFPEAGMGGGFRGDIIFENSKNMEYQVLVANGFQDSAGNPFQSDGNASKAVAAHLRFDVIRKFQFGKSFYLDHPYRGRAGFVFSDGYEVEFTPGRWALLAELVVGNFYLGRKHALQQKSFLLQVSRQLPRGFSPYLRAELINPNSRVDDDWVWAHTGGVNWESGSIYSLRLEAALHQYQDHAPDRLRGGSYAEVRAGLVAGF